MGLWKRRKVSFKFFIKFKAGSGWDSSYGDNLFEFDISRKSIKGHVTKIHMDLSTKDPEIAKVLSIQILLRKVEALYILISKCIMKLQKVKYWYDKIKLRPDK